MEVNEERIAVNFRAHIILGLIIVANEVLL